MDTTLFIFPLIVYLVNVFLMFSVPLLITELDGFFPSSSAFRLGCTFGALFISTNNLLQLTKVLGVELQFGQSV